MLIVEEQVVTSLFDSRLCPLNNAINTLMPKKFIPNIYQHCSQIDKHCSTAACIHTRTFPHTSYTACYVSFHSTLAHVGTTRDARPAKQHQHRGTSGYRCLVRRPRSSNSWLLQTSKILGERNLTSPERGDRSGGILRNKAGSTSPKTKKEPIS